MNMIERRQLQSSGGFKRNPLPLEPGNCFRRALTARVVADLTRCSAGEVAARMWPSDRVLAELVERAAVAPAMTGVPGWAAELATRVVVDAVDALAPVSAAGVLLKQCLVLNWDGAGIISAPSFVAAASNGGFVAEGDPIPVRQLNSTPAQLLPYKLASISVLTVEMVESSNAEKLISDTLVRSAGLAADAVLFDSNPATAARPAGLRNGIAALPASTDADWGQAFASDLAALIAATSAVGGNGPYIIVGGPGLIAGMALRFISNIENVVLAATAAVGNDMIVIAAPAVVAALDPEPEIETSNAATLVMDTAPPAVGTTGARNQGLFQTNSIAVKVRWPISWALRDPRGLAWTTPKWK